MDITINVNIGVTPELKKLMTQMLQSAAIRTTVADWSICDAVNEKGAEEPAEETAETAEAATASTEQKSEKKFTAQDVRTAMEECRKKLEFTEGSEEPNADIHRKLTATFKKIAIELEGVKPSELSETSRGAFIEMVSTITISKDGEAIYDM